jgi:hypothetical protein
VAITLSYNHEPSEHPPASSSVSSDPGHVSAPSDQEVVYFDGRPVLRGEIGFAVVAVAIGLLVLITPVLIRIFGGEFPNAGVITACVIIGLALPLSPVIFTRTIRYRITSYRIDYEHGIVSKNIDTLELWHVDDISYHQSLVDRMLKVGNITVVSNDATTPKLELKGLPDARPIFDSLKNRVIAVKRQRGVIKFDAPGPG